MAGLIAMAAMFAGASRALLASVVFAFETTLQSSGLLPLLGGCSAAYLLSSMLMKHTIMTEKIARRGLHVPSDYAADFLARSLVREVASRNVQTLSAGMTVGEVRALFASPEEVYTHQAFPVVDEHGELLGVVTKRLLQDRSKSDQDQLTDLITRPPAVVFEDNTLREAADLMVMEKVGRLPVVLRDNPLSIVGIISRSDLLHAHSSRLTEEHETSQTIRLSLP
jgi:CBS domain-containing protein